MTAAANSHLKSALEDSLEEFAPHERMSADCMQLIRAAYKQFHHGGSYHKGKGKEFEEWRRKLHAGTMHLKLERAEGGRQDLAFDGALPLFVNRVIFLEFLRELVFVPDHQNILEDYLWIVLRSNEMTALRPCRHMPAARASRVQSQGNSRSMVG